MGNDKRSLGRRPLHILLAIAVLALIYWAGPQSDEVASNGDSANQRSVDPTTSSQARDASSGRPETETSETESSEPPRTPPSRTSPTTPEITLSPEMKVSLDGVDLAKENVDARDERPRERDARPPPGKPSANRSADSARSSGKSNASQSDADSDDPLYGLLREVSSRRYLSPAGLLYGPGSAEGHRLEHLRRHTKDDPGRRGSHGVFDGDMAGALATIDSAYKRAKSGQRTTKEVDGDRTIYTVDLGKRIGYVGGSSGKRRGNPMARRVRLVVEGNYVVTAFPL